MPLYHLDESREPRECPGCKDCTTAAVGPTLSTAFREHDARPRCNGTGRLGVEGAEPDVEVFYLDGGYRFRTWRTVNGQTIGREDSLISGLKHPTPEAALAAAREAARKGD